MCLHEWWLVDLQFDFLMQYFGDIFATFFNDMGGDFREDFNKVGQSLLDYWEVLALNNLN